MRLKLIRSKTTWRNVGDGMEFFMDWSSSPMAARF